ncbi:hypothetical protein TNCV_3343051, partial [Trichonephila clavipes]
MCDQGNEAIGLVPHSNPHQASVAATFILGSAAVSDGASLFASPASCEVAVCYSFSGAKKKSARKFTKNFVKSVWERK